MTAKSRGRSIATTLSIILLIIAFITSLTGIFSGSASVTAAKKEWTDLKSQLDELDANLAKLSDGKSDYEAKKSAYDADKAEYDKKYDEYAEADKKYNEDVLSYNQKLIAYNVGKTQLGGTAVTAIAEGQKKLDEGKAAYEQGLAAYEQGKAEFDEKKQEYEQSKAMYDGVMEALNELESKGIPHSAALAAISIKAGTPLSDDYLSLMKTGLDAAEMMVTQGEATLTQSKQQLDAAGEGITQGQQQLDSAKAQISQAEAQINAIGGEIASGPQSLSEQGAKISEMKSSLDSEKEALDKRADALKTYEDTEEKVNRASESLKGEGYDGSSAKELLSSARVREKELKGEYNRLNTSHILNYVCDLIAIAAATAGLIILGKGKTQIAFIISLAAAVIGAAALVASIIYGKVDVYAFAAAALAFAAAAFARSDEKSKKA